ncbi:hypothetical protein Bca52824_058594 [Brassica carinata]|uniref:Uncharacterized protein n=1 Tax=Brassica carinata TaxID=52824 RepID=A0A8X7QZS0_BRACI|nr:hypothetical protein Bca52824_058594 [Brassica carinata]
MGLDYSYSLASESEDLFGHSVDSGFSETSDLIRRDQAELSLRACERLTTLMTEVEFGFPDLLLWCSTLCLRVYQQPTSM